jgi:uncharacterized protein YbjT (DUF2867 family)
MAFCIPENRVADTLIRNKFVAFFAAFFLFSHSGSTAELDKATTRSNEPYRVLILGGTGQLGRAIISDLRARPVKLSIFARANSDRSGLEPASAAPQSTEWLTGDLMTAADIDRAFDGRRFDIVINAVRVEDNDIHFYEKLMGPVTRNARRAGVKLFIHHSAVGAGNNVEKFRNMGWERVPGIFDRLKDQGVGEDILRASGIPYVIIRNARLYPAKHPGTGNAVLTEDDSILTAMTRIDLARLTVGCIDNPECVNKTYHVSDPSLPYPPTPAW